MNKKLLVVAIALLLVVSGAAFAAGPLGMTAVGVYGTFGDVGVPGVGLTMKWGNFPVVGIAWNFSSNSYLGVSVDGWVLNDGLGGTALAYFVGIGGFASLYTAGRGDSGMFDLGLRAPIGLQLYPVKKVELYLSAVPLVRLLPSISLNIGADVGLRIHF